jgi:hypothetical protein
LAISNTPTDWNLGTTYTIEYWSKSSAVSDDERTVMTQVDPLSGGKIHVGYGYGHVYFNDNYGTQFDEPTPTVWTHVAFVRESGSGNITLYYNGVNVTTFNAGAALTDGVSTLYIGYYAPPLEPGPADGFLGKLAMIRVSSTAKYLANFNPTVTYGVEADTKLMLGSDTPLVDTSASAHTITNIGVTQSMDFPT